MQRRSFLTGIAATTALAAPSPTRAQGLTTVRCGSVPLDGYGQPYFGVAAGIFRDAGIDLQITNLANSGAIAAAITGGSLDVGLGSVSQIAGAKEKGIPYTFFAPGAVYSADAPSSQLMVEKTSPIHAARDLVGKTVAVDNLTSFTQFATLEWLKKNGVDPSSVKFVELPYPAMPAALDTGRVDAALIAEPARTAALATARLVADTNAAIAPTWFISVWFTTEAWMAANLALAHRLARAVVQTSSWANVHHPETAGVLETITKMPHDVILAMSRSRFGTKLDPALMDPLIDIAAKNNMISAPIAARTLIYPGFAS
ncbi:MAG TPA: ABC transporter substrate-binding protein [Candidatus Lustribacter sp.]|jgi:NitT/TauT family transport system substrate-binding protein|nr:ABC transporter substrate-binding protein [Candidatus Lustribacter sp.]